MKRIVLTVCFALILLKAFCGSFTPGNIVVIRLGDGSAALASTATAVFLDEYTPGGTLVQSIALPVTANGNNHILTLSGTAASEGALSLSGDGKSLVLAGYDAAVGAASGNGDATTNRTIGNITADGTVNTSTGINGGSAYTTNNVRGATTNDGSGFWLAGAGKSSTGGTWYVPAGSFTGTPVQISTTVTNSRAVSIFGGQLYISDAKTNFGVSTVGTGLPTTAGQSTTVLPCADFGSASDTSIYSFYFLDEDPNIPGVDVMYLADSRTASPDGGVYKFSLVDGSWVSNGNITSATSLTGITAVATCGGVNIYASGATGIFSMRDSSGYNQTINGSLTQIVTAATNTSLHDIAFTPGTTAPPVLHVQTTLVDSIICNGAANGAINIIATGGSGSYTYNWGGNVTTQNRNDLAPGNYTVTVTDGSGCSATTSATISQPEVLNAAVTGSGAKCHDGNTGSANLIVNGGTQPYTFNWGGGITVQDPTNLTAGNYTVTISDSHSCTITSSVNIGQPDAITITDSITNLPCVGGGNTGAVNITVNGGTPAYNYTWSNDSTSKNISGLTANTYTVTVTDGNNCTATLSAIVSNSGNLKVAAAVSNVKCNDQANGSINLTVSGGTPNYTFAWSNDSTGPNISKLAAATYTVTVTDQGGCISGSSITVTQPNALTAATTVNDVSCNGGTNGSIDLTVNGGTKPYTYAWSNLTSLQNLSEAGQGVYTVNITDSNSCTLSITDTVRQPDSLSLTFAVTNVSAFGQSNGSIELTVTGGTENYAYNWDNGSGSQDISGLAAGNYCVTVTDKNSCTAEQCETVSQPEGINNVKWMDSFSAYTTGGNLFVNATLPTEMNCTIALFDIAGRTLFTNAVANATILKLQIPVLGISQGCYFIRINTEQGAASKKIFITE